MKKTLLLLLLVSITSSIWAQEKKLLPIEITSDDFLLKYKYDNQNRIIERYFKNYNSEVRDSIAYIPHERKYEVYIFNNTGDTHKYSYISGKQRDSGKWLNGDHNKDGAFNYLIDNQGYIQRTEGREWDGSWDGGGANQVSYIYKNGNLHRFYLDSKKQQANFIKAMAPWEQEIFDEEISYEKHTGIFSQVNTESRWLLGSPLEEFYPILHLKNNALKIKKASKTENILRESDEYPFATVIYKYNYNKFKYPEKMAIKVSDEENGNTVDREFVIKYKDANTTPPQVAKVKKLPSDKKLLPKRIFGTGFSMDFTYDNLNRFIGIKEVQGNQILRQDSIIYYPNNEGYRIISLNGNEADTKYKRKNNQVIINDGDESRTEITFTPTGMVSMMQIIDADYDPETSIDPPMIIGFIYDENDNLVDMYLPNNASGDRVNRNLQMIEYMIMKYDDKNGIFKHVNRDCFMILYNQAEILKFYYYMGNNLLLMEDEGDPNSTHGFSNYEYNIYDYPNKMNKRLSIEYIDAN